MRERKRRGISVKRWMIRYLSGLLILILAGLMIVFWYTQREMKRQMTVASGNVLEVFMEKTDSSLISVDRYLRINSSNNMDWSVLAVSGDPLQRNSSIYNIRMELQRSILVYYALDGLFFYSQTDQGEVFLSQCSVNASAQDERSIYGLLTQTEGAGTPGWQFRTIDGRGFMLNIVESGSNRIGAWVRTDHLLDSLENIDFYGDGFCALTASDGGLLTDRTEEMGDWVCVPGDNYKCRINGRTFFQIGKRSEAADLCIVALIPESVIVEQLRSFRVFLYLVFGVIVLVVPVTSILLGRRIVGPVSRVADAMEQVEKGDLSVRLTGEERIRELGYVAQRFNSMTGRIETLTEDVYQRTIREQKIRLQYLQLQIKPHFFLNALNLIYSFAQIKRMDLIQKLTLHLVEYFRYQFSDVSRLVRLQDEIRHVQNYMAIQELRFPGTFRFVSGVADGLGQAMLPPMVIQTFIENSIKYAMDEEEERTVSLHVYRESEKDGRITIIVEDNGEGYPGEILAAYAGGKAFSSDEKMGIGIYNARQRLAIIYGDAAELVLENAPEGGARTVIRIPWGG